MTWQNDELNEMLTCKAPEQVFGLLLKEAKLLGLENAAWGIQLPVPTPADRFVLLNSYSTAWQQRYAEQGYLQLDPTVKQGFASTLPILWADAMQKEPEFWEDARSFGLKEGIAQSVWDCHGAGSMLSISRDSLPFSVIELREKIPKVSWLAQVAHAAMTRLLVPKQSPSTATDLTPREKQILRLISDGLTVRQIADKLRLHERTPDFHLKNARKKLQASNSAEAVFRASVLGII